MAAFGSLPRYDIYLDMIKSYGANGWGDLSFATTSMTWILAGMLYFSAISLAICEALKGRRSDSHSEILVYAFPISVAGIVTLFYWVGRPLEFNLLPTIVPAILLGALVVDHLCIHMMRVYWRRTTYLVPIALSVMVAGSVLGYAYQVGSKSIRLDFAEYLTSK